MTDVPYIGKELELFAHARNWKKYWSAEIAGFVRGDVLEAGAGIGSNTPYLKTPNVASWTCLEPDAELAEQLTLTLRAQPELASCQIITGTTASALAGQAFDTVLYIDVLEHIEDDRAELERAAQLLRPGGHLIVLSPAFASLYSEFDRAIGHFRRHSKSSLRACGPANCRLLTLRYLDSASFLLSKANRLLLKQRYPTLRQILMWDRIFVPLSRLLDRCVFHAFGKSILAVWDKP